MIHDHLISVFLYPTTKVEGFTKLLIKQATAIPNGIFILNIGIVIIGLSLIINQASTKSTIDGIAFAIAGVALAISATTWRKDVLNQINSKKNK